MQKFIIYICCGLMLLMLVIVVSLVSLKPKSAMSEELVNTIKLEKQYFLSKIPASQQAQEWERTCDAIYVLSRAIMNKRQEGVEYEALLELTQGQAHMLHENAKRLQILILDQAFATRVYQGVEDKMSAVEHYGTQLYDVCMAQ